MCFWKTISSGFVSFKQGMVLFLLILSVRLALIQEIILISTIQNIVTIFLSVVLLIVCLLFKFCLDTIQSIFEINNFCASQIPQIVKLLLQFIKNRLLTVQSGQNSLTLYSAGYNLTFFPYLQEFLDSQIIIHLGVKWIALK